MKRRTLTSRDLATTAANPICQRLKRLLVTGVSDEDGYRLLAGEELPAGRGERTAALRYGRLFDGHLVDKRATALLTSIREIAPFDPHTVRILDAEAAARARTKDPLRHAMLLTERALHDAARQQPSQDILLQPALRLSRATWGTMIVRPDALVLDRARNCYWPLEAKAYPAIDGRIEPAERRTMRLQAAVQLTALHDSPGVTQPVSTEAILVVGSAFGLTPEPAVLENLDAEVSLIVRAIDAINAEVASLHAARDSATPAALLREASFHLQESCVIGCGLLSYCRAEQSDVRSSLGDTAVQLLPAPLGDTGYLADLQDRAPETYAVWRELAAVLNLGANHAAS